MRATVKVISGPEAGRTVSLGIGDVVRVGRGEQASFVLALDSKLSQFHFALRLRKDGVCSLRDLNSTNGLYRNGLAVVETTVVSGDKIVAGKSTFEIVIDGQPPINGATNSPSSVEDGSTVPRRFSAPPSDEFPINPEYKLEACASGLSHFTPAAAQPSAVAVARRLAKLRPFYLMVDFPRAEIEAPEDLEPAYVFDWLPPQRAKEFSPVLLAANESAGAFRIIEQAWGKDAVICLFSERDGAALLSQFRRVVRDADNAPSPRSKSVLGCCWPKVMAQLLMHSEPAFANKLMDGIDAVLMEAKPPVPWQVFSGRGFRHALDELGFSRVGAISGDGSSILDAPPVKT